MKLIKKVMIFLSVIFIVVIIFAIYFGVKNFVNNVIKENAYIDIWLIPDRSNMAQYSIERDLNEKIYLGKPYIHYLINKNGKVYTYEANSYENKIIGKRDWAIVKYIKTFSQSELENLENELKSAIKLNSVDTSGLKAMSCSYWKIIIDGNSNTVNVKVVKSILNKYLY